jgi:ribonucleoside-diphosphate reductase beta chain
MPNILKPRIEFKPFEYEWAFDYWTKQQNAHWLHTEISMQKDVKDWEEKLTESDKNVIGNILKGFAQTECAVNDYWSQYVTKWFPKHEIKMMAVTFGAFETIHATAYSYLNDTLGLDDFAAFLQDEATMNKLGKLIEIDPNDDSLENIALSLALFSACAEGIQLFSSFAVMLSFRKNNLMKGIGQQMVFSVKDESLHSEAGCKLFRVLIEENPSLFSEAFKARILEGFQMSLDVEFKYIDKIFEMGDLETISKKELKNFMLDRANRKLKELNLKPVYKVDQHLLKDMNWFYELVSGEIQTDFFSNRETGYAKAGEDWNDKDSLFD